MEKETLTFEHERETKNTIRYQEITEASFLERLGYSLTRAATAEVA